MLDSNDYRDLIEALIKDEKSSTRALDIVEDTIPLVAGLLGIGRIELASAEKGTSVTCYDGAPVGDGPAWERRCELADGVERTFVVHPREGVAWSDEDRQSIDAVMGLIELTLGRTMERELRLRSQLTDPLTGLPNLGGLRDAAHEILDGTSKLTAVHVNVRGFRAFNKSIGYVQADRLLARYAAALADGLADDEVVCRIGGANFAALLHARDADAFAERARTFTCDLDAGWGTHALTLEADLGAFDLGEKDRDLDHALMAASVACQAAKETPADGLTRFTPSMSQVVAGDASVLEAFEEALADAEFVVRYQPKVDLATGDAVICGGEGLARWMRDGSLVEPDEFVGALERGGVIGKLDMFVFRTLCADMRTWLDAGAAVPVMSSNFSMRHVRDEGFVGELCAIADAYGIDHALLEVELSEASLDDVRRLTATAHALHAEGFRVCLDDFGTGSSSLLTLMDVPLDVVKLDRTLIARATGTGARAAATVALIRHVVALFAEMGFDVLAEGVETIDQRRMLQAVDCARMQGFLFAEPMRADEFAQCL